jgi:hypothetical protein
MEFDDMASDAMGTLGRMFNRTRRELIEVDANETAEEFVKRFGMRDGDYLEFERFNNKGKSLPTLARIVSVEAVWWNANGGYTANVKVAPMLGGGRIGNTRSIFLTVRANGTGLSSLQGRIRRIGQNKE